MNLLYGAMNMNNSNESRSSFEKAQDFANMVILQGMEHQERIKEMNHAAYLEQCRRTQDAMLRSMQDINEW